ncbi:MAG: hypothetical protein LWX56_06225 [Ignavibacteria bacterium]|nr:hypothetical protein [Ignavibacteria bacterium]
MNTTFSLHAGITTWIFVFLVIATAIVMWYYYRYTIPSSSRLQKNILRTLRFLAVIFAILLATEPIISITRKSILQPLHYVFIDNSFSMSNESQGYKKKSLVNDFIKLIRETVPGGTLRVYSFGSNLKMISEDSVQFLQYKESATNFSEIPAELLKSESPVSSITLISDGIQNEGEDPTGKLERIHIPVFSVACGDTTAKKDIVIAEILANNPIYAGVVTPLRVNLLCNKLGGKAATIHLYEETNQISQKTITLSEGINQITTDYTPKTAGEKKITATLDLVNGESNRDNNSKTIFITVKESKQKILLVAGTPSADLTFIKNALQADTNLIIKTIVEIGQNKTLEPYNSRVLDSASAYFFINFPLDGSSPQLVQQLLTHIKTNHKPFFIIPPEQNATTKLELLSDQMPVRIKPGPAGSLPGQVVISGDNLRHPILLASGMADAAIWNDLPPVLRLNYDAVAKPESDVLLLFKSGTNILKQPILAARSIGNQRSITLLVKDIWRWQLSLKGHQEFFGGFILACNKWLTAGSDHERLVVHTSRKVYTLGERIDFAAELYDESFNPLSDEKITLELIGKNFKNTVQFNPINNGIYESSIEVPATGDYTYIARYEGTPHLTKTGRITIGGQDLELQNSTTDKAFLTNLSRNTGGEVYFSTIPPKYLEILKKLSTQNQSEKVSISEIPLWNNMWTLVVVILLFSFEWLMRKRSGML